MLIFYSIIAIATVPLGAGIAIVSQKKQTQFGLVFGFTAGIVLGIVLMLMVDFYQELGYATIIVMWVGFGLIWLIERLVPHNHADSAEHTHGKKKHLWGINITLIGLTLHSIADGFNLSVAAEEHEVGIALALAVLIHRVPVATVITAALRRDYSFAKTALQLTPLMLAPLVGAFMGERLLHGIFEELVEYLTAFAAGTLLHVMMDGLRGNYTPSSEESRGASKIAFVIGLILTLCAIYFFPGLELEHTHSH